MKERLVEALRLSTTSVAIRYLLQENVFDDQHFSGSPRAALHAICVATGLLLSLLAYRLLRMTNSRTNLILLFLVGLYSAISNIYAEEGHRSGWNSIIAQLFTQFVLYFIIAWLAEQLGGRRRPE